MSWAARRRFLILLIVGACLTAFLLTIAIATFHKTPSCTDNTQNQDEEGIDCGGSCPYLCSAQKQPPTVLFTKALTNSSGRTDVVAAIENKNAFAAAKNVPYRITLYGAKQSLIQEVTGTVDLLPSATALVYVPGVASGKQVVVGAFLSIASSSPQWFLMTTDPRIVPNVSNTQQGGTPDAPRIEAVLSNSSVITLHTVPVIVMVRDTRGEVIAASKTLVSTIPAQGQATAIVTWNSAFTSTPASIEVVPIIPLP
ncbi:MAG: hypothetical protein NT108_00015 [Candidatus Kaiserbacteria bacterium]|nr:hypothetical protein [Candidatus Kaiserbacteria bacterium]